MSLRGASMASEPGIHDPEATRFCRNSQYRGYGFRAQRFALPRNDADCVEALMPSWFETRASLPLTPQTCPRRAPHHEEQTRNRCPSPRVSPSPHRQRQENASCRVVTSQPIRADKSERRATSRKATKTAACRRRKPQRRAWATVNKEEGGGNKSGSGRGVPRHQGLARNAAGASADRAAAPRRRGGRRQRSRPRPRRPRQRASAARRPSAGR